MKQLKDCKYSAFISYASADDVDNYNWISIFVRELFLQLKVKCRGLQEPFKYKTNGIQNGLLDEKIRETIAESFLMIVFVHEAYAASEACMQELREFVTLFGDAGLKNRLFIVAMGKRWALQLGQLEPWKSLIPASQVWANFTNPESEDMPLAIYVAGATIVDEPFKVPFNPFREAVLECFKEGNQPANLPVSQQHSYGENPAAARTMLFGAARPELDAAVKELAEVARARGEQVQICTESDLLRGPKYLKSGQRLILVFNDGELLMPERDGGHLGYQLSEWLKLGKSADDVIWLYLQDVRPPADEIAAGPQAEYLKGRRAQSVSELPQIQLPEVAQPAPDSVLIYIESNIKEVRHWALLGEQIRRRWEVIARKKGVVPPMYFRKRGLPIDEIATFASLSDADGFVLLWGQKEGKSLVSQIREVEARTPGNDIAPGIVAFLMPPQKLRTSPVPAWGWQVLRFKAEPLDDIDVIQEEETELDSFLGKILARAQARRLASRGMKQAAGS